MLPSVLQQTDGLEANSLRYGKEQKALALFYHENVYYGQRPLVLPVLLLVYSTGVTCDEQPQMASKGLKVAAAMEVLKV